MPNKEMLCKWVKALESGEFKKCRGSLRRVDRNGEERYCVLGVGKRVLFPDTIVDGGTMASHEWEQIFPSEEGVLQNAFFEKNDSTRLGLKSLGKWIRKTYLTDKETTVDSPASS